MNIANKISTFRILLVPFFIASLLYYTPERDYLRFVALVLFSLASISDAADGFVARLAKQVTPAGRLLDPLGDKLLLMSAFIVLAAVRTIPVRFPVWVSIIVISRDAIILIGALVIYMVKQHIEIAVLCVLLQFEVSPVAWWLAVIFTLISGGDYIRRGFKVLYA